MKIKASICSTVKKIGIKNSWPYVLMVSLGVLLRAIRLGIIHPLIFDEASRFLSIVGYSFGQLLHLREVSSNIHDPFGFLVIIKVLINLFGYSEIALRLFPFICGIASIGLMARLAQRFVDKRVGKVALALFCVSPYVIMYAATLKPYSSDILIAAFFYLLFLRIYETPVRKVQELLLYGTGGALAVWISQPAIFFISGSGLAVFILLVQGRRWRDVIKFCALMLFWLLNFLVLYHLSFKSFVHWDALVGEWAPFLAPKDPGIGIFIKWLVTRFYMIFRKPVVVIPLIGLPLFFIGIFDMLKQNRAKSMIIFFPLLATFLAASLRKYPLGERAVMYLLPMFCLAMAQGWEYFCREDKARFKIVTVFITVALFWAPVRETLVVIKPKGGGGKPAVQYILKHFKENDVICVAQSARKEFLYYKYLYNIPENNYIIAPSFDKFFITNKLSDQLRGYDRVWLFVHHAYLYSDVFLVHMMNNWGREVSRNRAAWCLYILYEMKHDKISAE